MLWLLLFISISIVAMVTTLAIVGTKLYNYPKTNSDTKMRPFYPRNVIARGWSGGDPTASEQKYLDFHTEYLAKSEDMQHMLTASLVWVRAGSPNVFQKLGYKLIRTSDVDTFVHDILPKRTTPFTLITSDGDRSIPSELRDETVRTLLASPLLKQWYTQNYDGTDPRIQPIPIGLCFHVAQNPQDPQIEFDRIRSLYAWNSDRKLRVWSDVHLGSYPLRFGNPRQKFKKTIPKLRFIDTIKARIKTTDLWKKYTEYAFVMSLPGNGVDCHRTWEALYLGAIVIVLPNALIPLYKGYRVEVVPEHEWESKLNDETWLLKTYQKHMENTPVFNETSREWLEKHSVEKHSVEKHD